MLVKKYFLTGQQLFSDLEDAICNLSMKYVLIVLFVIYSLIKWYCSQTRVRCVLAVFPCSLFAHSSLFKIVRKVPSNLLQNLWLCYVAKTYSPICKLD